MDDKAQFVQLSYEFCIGGILLRDWDVFVTLLGSVGDDCNLRIPDVIHLNGADGDGFDFNPEDQGREYREAAKALFGEILPDGLSVSLKIYGDGSLTVTSGESGQDLFSVDARIEDEGWELNADGRTIVSNPTDGIWVFE